jgi:hypothetical protein
MTIIQTWSYSIMYQSSLAIPASPSSATFPSGGISSMSLSQCGNLLALGDGKGCIAVFSLDTRSSPASPIWLPYHWQGHTCSVMQLLIVPSSLMAKSATPAPTPTPVTMYSLISVDGAGVTKQWSITLPSSSSSSSMSSSPSVECHFVGQLPNRYRVCSLACTRMNDELYVICGDNNGCISVFTIHDNTTYDTSTIMSVSSRIRGAHGAEQVTSIHVTPSISPVSSSPRMMSTGRNACVAEYSLVLRSSVPSNYNIIVVEKASISDTKHASTRVTKRNTAKAGPTSITPSPAAAAVISKAGVPHDDDDSDNSDDDNGSESIISDTDDIKSEDIACQMPAAASRYVLISKRVISLTNITFVEQVHIIGNIN